MSGIWKCANCGKVLELVVVWRNDSAERVVVDPETKEEISDKLCPNCKKPLTLVLVNQKGVWLNV